MWTAKQKIIKKDSLCVRGVNAPPCCDGLRPGGCRFNLQIFRFKWFSFKVTLLLGYIRKILVYNKQRKRRECSHRQVVAGVLSPATTRGQERTA